MAWLIAMIAISPLMFAGTAAKGRTWLALMAACGAAWLAPDVRWFIVVDFVCATVVLANPYGCAQRMIGLLLAAMMIFSVGYIIGGEQAPGMFTAFQHALGWAQWAILAWWGGYDLLGNRVVDWWHRWSLHHRPSGHV